MFKKINAWLVARLGAKNAAQVARGVRLFVATYLGLAMPVLLAAHRGIFNIAALWALVPTAIEVTWRAFFPATPDVPTPAPVPAPANPDDPAMG